MDSPKPDSPQIIEKSETDAEIEALLQALREAARAREKQLRLLFNLGPVTIFITLMPQFIRYYHLKNAGYLFAVTSLSVCVLVMRLRYAGALKNKKMIRKALTSGSLRVVGPLLQMLSADEKTRSKPAYEALTKLLPQIQSLSELTIEDRFALCNLIGIAKNQEFILTALETVACFQDGLAVNGVRKQSTDGLSWETRKCALNILPLLESVAQRDEQSAVLLRPSSANDAGNANTLLRPASEKGSATPPNELLRPAETVEGQTQSAQDFELQRTQNNTEKIQRISSGL